MEKLTVARSGFSLVWRRRNQLLAGYPYPNLERFKDNIRNNKNNSGLFLRFSRFYLFLVWIYFYWVRNSFRSRSTLPSQTEASQK